MVRDPKAIVGHYRPGNRSKPTSRPPLLFPQTCSEEGEDRAEFSPLKEINLPKEARLIFFFLMLLNYIYTIYIFTNLLWVPFIGGSAGQPPPDPNGRALSQPRPHPSDKIV